MLGLAGPLFCDVMMGERLLLNMVDLKVVLNRNSDKFCLMGKNNNPIKAKIKMLDATLKIRKVTVSDVVSKAHEMALRTPAIYPIRRVECKAFTIPANLPSIRKDDMFNGIIPKMFVCGFVDADVYTGTYGKNPYNFKTKQVTSVSLTANGEQIPLKQINLNYPSGNDKDNNFIEAFNMLFSGTGKMYYNTGLDIDREDYGKDGYTIYAWDLTPDMCGASSYFNTVQRGSLTLDITLATSSEVSSLVCYADFENVRTIDADRSVTYDIST